MVGKTPKSLAKCQRTCVICGVNFQVRSADRIGRTCSKECSRKNNSIQQTGRKQSEETINKRQEKLNARMQDPVYREKWKRKMAEGIRAWHAIPENAALASQRSSERLKKLHKNPEYRQMMQAVRSQTMKQTWSKYRDKFIELAKERYASGAYLNSAEANRKRDAAGKWIMTKVQAALREETNYVEVFLSTQARIRIEFPYDGPTTGELYQDYLQELGRRVVRDATLCKIAADFMHDAIPRFAAEWHLLAPDKQGAELPAVVS